MKTEAYKERLAKQIERGLFVGVPASMAFFVFCLPAEEFNRGHAYAAISLFLVGQILIQITKNVTVKVAEPQERLFLKLLQLTSLGFAFLQGMTFALFLVQVFVKVMG